MHVLRTPGRWTNYCSYLMQYSKALRVSVPWLQANPEQAAALKPMLSIVFKRAFELRASHGGGGGPKLAVLAWLAGLAVLAG